MFALPEYCSRGLGSKLVEHVDYQALKINIGSFSLYRHPKLILKVRVVVVNRGKEGTALKGVLIAR